jgi:N-acetylneuraminic acid mutarotase
MKTLRIWQRIAVVISLMFTLATVSFAADVNGRIKGVVTDPSGAVVAGVHILAVNLATGVSFDAVTGGDGVYLFAQLPVGTYSVTAAAPQFKKFTATGITLNIDQEYVENIQLTVGQANEVVQVSAAAVQVDTTDMQLSNVVNSHFLPAVLLPLSVWGIQFWIICIILICISSISHKMHNAPPSPPSMYSPPPCDFSLFLSLPEEMSFQVVSFLSAYDVCTLERTSRDFRRFSGENMVWRMLCKHNGWVVPRPTLKESTRPFDYKRYFSEKTLLSKPGCLRWGDKVNSSGTMPSKRFKHTATVVGKHIIFIAGQETDTKRFNEIIYFDSDTKSFSIPIINGDRVPNFSRHTACLIGSKIYIFGGFDGQGTNFDLSTFDPYSRTWTNISKLTQKGDPPPSRTNHAAAAIGKNMYIFGGNNNNEEGKYQVLDDFNMLDTHTMTWCRLKTTGSAPCARSGHTLTAIGKKLYLFGGGVWNERDGWVQKFNDLHIFDTETLHWTKAEYDGKIDSSTFPISFAISRFLFIFGGGSKPLQSVTNDLYILDTASLAWSFLECEGNKPLARDMGTASTVGDTVYFLGGYAGGAVDYFDNLVVSCGTALSSSGSASC